MSEVDDLTPSERLAWQTWRTQGLGSVTDEHIIRLVRRANRLTRLRALRAPRIIIDKEVELVSEAVAAIAAAFPPEPEMP